MKLEDHIKMSLSAWFNLNSFEVPPDWDEDRKRIAALQLLCRREGIDVGKIDGLVGEQTRFAFEAFDGRKVGDLTVEHWRDGEVLKKAIRSSPESMKWPREMNVAETFGYVGDNQVQITPPYEMVLGYDLNERVRKITCHKLVSESLERVLIKIREIYTQEEIKKLKLNLFDGGLNVRRKRGGSQWSMHAYGIAFDFAALYNQLRWNHRKALFAKNIYAPWFEAWESEGAISLGRTKDYDWMHTQFARL